MEILNKGLAFSILLVGVFAYSHNYNVGFRAPSVYGTASAYSPERGGIVFDTITNVFWGNSGTPSTPDWVSLTQTTQNYASGYFNASYGWSMSTTDSNFHDFSNTAVGTFNVVNSAGTTVTAASSNVIGITFTPASAIATYRITFKGMFCTGTATYAGFRLYDSGNSIQVDETYNDILLSSGEAALSGIYTPGTTSSVTISVQTAIGNGYIDCGGNYTGNGFVDWDIQQIK